MSHHRAIAAAVILGTLPVAGHAAEIQIKAENPVVELTITESVKAAPDAARVGAGVSVRATTAVEAMRQNAAAMDKVIARLRQLGIARGDIQTTDFNLNAQYRYHNDGEQPTFLGYEANNRVSVTLRDLTKVGETLDALAQAGANNFNGPTFLLEKDEAAKAAARRAAYDRAGRQARDYAAMAGFSGVRLLEVSETYAVGATVGSASDIVVTAQSAKTPIEPGRVDAGVTVTTKYEMTR